MSRSRLAFGVIAGTVLLALVLGRGGPSVITHGPRDQRWIALTFDADMTWGMLSRLKSGAVPSWYDPEIVSELKRTRTSSTIFLTGLWAETYPAVVESLAQDPLFELENHSADHTAFETPCYGLSVLTSEVQKKWEVASAAAVITHITGVEPRYFRFPGGCHGRADLDLVTSLGERPLEWDVVAGDAFETDPAVVVSTVLGQVQPGSIVIMHLMGAPNAPATATALRMLIPILRARGFRFVTVRELLSQAV